MIVVQGFLRTAPENAAKLRSAAATLVAATREEPGNLAYAFAEDISEPGLFHVIERWADEAAIAAHNVTPHFAAFMGAIPAIGVTAARIARYDAPGEQVLIGG